MTDPVTDPRVVAARSRVRQIDRTLERFADVTAETSSSGAATMQILGRIDADGAPWGISAKDVAQALEALPDGTGRLDVHIHSRGGDAFEGLAILNMLRQSKAEVHTYVDGLAASAASAIAMAGKTVTMAPSSQLMIHDASGIGIGQANDMRILADALDSVSESYAAAYASQAGGTVAEWRAAMQPETWYRAEEAVKAGLATTVGMTPGTKLDAKALDLSIFAYAGRDEAPEPFIPTTQTPAASADGPTKTQEGSPTVDFTDEQLTTMRQALGLPEDADAAAIVAAQAEALAERAEAKTASPPDQIDLAAARAALEADGKVVMSKLVVDELTEKANLGAEARAKQLADERDETIQAAVKAGKISRDRVQAWTASWDKDPEGTKADLDSLEARFPVAAAPGVPGGDNAASTQPFTDDEASDLAALAGVRKEALTNG